MKIKTVGKWIWDHWSRLFAVGLISYMLYLFLDRIGEEHTGGVYSLEVVLTASAIWLVFALLMFSAGREGRISPKRYNKQLDDHMEFVDITIEMEDIQTGRLDYARDLLREQADRMPESSAKQKFLKQIDVL